jgi:hypothetical protein
MSEYQRYEFMTIDRPLTRVQLDEVNKLSSHIEASSTHALIEYHWGDFKHDPIKVLREFFDGFLYWANWGSPELAFRFPHGVLPADLIDDYDFDDFVTFTKHKEYELMEGDLRALYVAWLASQSIMFGYEEEYENPSAKATVIHPLDETPFLVWGGEEESTRLLDRRDRACYA